MNHINQVIFTPNLILFRAEIKVLRGCRCIKLLRSSFSNLKKCSAPYFHGPKHFEIFPILIYLTHQNYPFTLCSRRLRGGAFPTPNIRSIHFLHTALKPLYFKAPRPLTPPNFLGGCRPPTYVRPI